jgi:hypothetical protein
LLVHVEKHFRQFEVPALATADLVIAATRLYRPDFALGVTRRDFALGVTRLDFALGLRLYRPDFALGVTAPSTTLV